MRLLITGCGHSGTHWLAQLLRHAGYRTGHEFACGHGGWQWNHAQDIEVSWCAAAFLDRLDGIEVWHLVRHPLAVAATFRRKDFFGSSGQHVELVRRTVPDLDPDFPELDYWLRWNRIAERHASDRWRVESIGEWFLDRVAQRFGRTQVAHPRVDHPHQHGRQDIAWWNYRRAGELSWLAKRYGYTLDG